MKVAVLPSAFFPSLGGVEELVRQMVHELKRRGDSPMLITNRWPRNLPSYESIEGLDLHRVPLRVPGSSMKAKLMYQLTNGKMQAEVNRLISDHGAEVIHVQCVSSNAMYAMRAKEALGLPLVVTLQGELTMDPGRSFEGDGLMRQILVEALDAADMITGVSDKTLSDVEAYCGKSFREKGRVIFNAANLNDFKTGEACGDYPPYIMAIGRLAPQKGFDLLLRAYAAGDVGDLKLVLAGEGPEEEPLRALAVELGIGDRVIFVGRVDHDRAVSLYLGAEMLVLSSRADEGLPVVIAEAMAAGCAIVATRSGGVAEAITDGVQGLLIDRGDEAGLREKMSLMASSSEMRDRMGAAALERSVNFTWPVVTEQYQAVYLEAIARYKSLSKQHVGSQ